MSISTYFRPNIHRDGPEILGVEMGEERENESESERGVE
jgi:hypothetical protein